MHALVTQCIRMEASFIFPPRMCIADSKYLYLVFGDKLVADCMDPGRVGFHVAMRNVGRSVASDAVANLWPWLCRCPVHRMWVSLLL